MKVEQIMNRNVKVCRAQDSLNKAAQIMWEEPCGAVPVVDEKSQVQALEPRKASSWRRADRALHEGRGYLGLGQQR
jgi:predicted transcriptional regulator